MAHPWIFESTFGPGTNGEWDSETDSAAQLDFPHYSVLAGLPWSGALPRSGAYCARCSLTGGTADMYLVEADIDIAANTARYVKFDIQIGKDFVASADDTINIFEALASSTVEATFGLRIVAATDVVNFGIGETAPTAFGPDIRKGVWYTVELTIDVDEDGEDDGTIDIIVTAEDEPYNSDAYIAQVDSLDQGAVTQGRFGCQDHLATTRGTILLDNFVMDDARMYPTRRFKTERTFTKTDHAWVGPGVLHRASLDTVTSGNIIRLFDTDNAEVLEELGYVIEIDADTAAEQVQNFGKDGIQFQRGCYVQMTGTNPIGTVNFTPRYNSSAQIRHYGQNRRRNLL